MNLSWVVDGVTYFESKFALPNLADLASRDVEIARRIASFSWYADDSLDTWAESVGSTVGAVSRIAASDIDLARKITGLSWFADRITYEEWVAVLYLSRLAPSHIELARKVAGLPWFVDDVTDKEAAAVHHLSDLADSDIELAEKITEHSWFTDRGTLGSYVLGSLAHLARLDTDVLSQLTDQRWFADGLDEEEAALVTILGWWGSRSPELYADLMRTYYTRYRAVSLPLAGEVNIWIFQNTPFPQNEDLLTIIEDTARISEGFLRVPFPTTDIILLVVDDVDGRYGIWRGGHYSSFMVLTRGPEGVLQVRHETAHYHFVLGPKWLVEGGAHFIETYVKDRTGVQSIADRKANVSQRVRSQCLDLNEIENIRHYAYVLGRSAGLVEACIYEMGEVLLFNVFEIFGEDILVSALGELFGLMLARESFEGGEDEMEELVFDTFLKHTPPELQEEFRDLYHRLHGGPYAYPVIDPLDDHGDDAATATEVRVGEVTTGTLDYHFDFDYFNFRAEEGQRYRIGVHHEALRSSSLMLYGHDGLARERTLYRWTATGRGPQIRWTPTSSGDYYLAVHNFGGKSGRYTLEITPVAPAHDDHGDSAATATDISIGTVVEATADYDFDVDFFRFQAVGGREYRIRIEGVTLPLSHIRLYTSDGETRFPWRATDDDGDFEQTKALPWGNSYMTWVAPSSGEVYLAADGAFGSVGIYRFIVSESDSPWVDLES